MLKTNRVEIKIKDLSSQGTEMHHQEYLLHPNNNSRQYHRQMVTQASPRAQDFNYFEGRMEGNQFQKTYKTQ